MLPRLIVHVTPTLHGVQAGSCRLHAVSRAGKENEMRVNARLVSLVTAGCLMAAPLLVSAKNKEKTSSEKVVQGTVVAATNDNLIIRKGKADWSMQYDAASRKLADLTAGTAVMVHYRDQNQKHIITTVELANNSAGGGKAQAK